MLYESTYYGVACVGDDSLQHHGIKGQKWGIRRFQYEDGILTPAGRARYDVGPREKKQHGTGDNSTRSKQQRRERAKKIAKGVAIGAAAAAGAYGAYRLGKHLSSDEKAYASALAQRMPDGRPIISVVERAGHYRSGEVKRTPVERIPIERIPVNRTKVQMSHIRSHLPKGMNLSELSMDDLRKLDLY